MMYRTNVPLRSVLVSVTVVDWRIGTIISGVRRLSGGRERVAHPLSPAVLSPPWRRGARLETLAARPATDVHARRARLADIRRLFETGPIDDDAVDSIRRGVGGLRERWPGPHAVRSSAELEDVEAAWGHRRGRGLGDAHTRSVSSPGDRRLAAAGLVQLYLRSETLENPWQHAARRERMQKAARDLLGPAAPARPARREPARHDHDGRPPAPHRPGDRAASGARPAAGRARPMESSR
jgi:hypothetical protein